MAFCGSGFLNVLNKLYKSKVRFNADIPQADSYGMSVVKHMCPFGTVYYKTHPLFSRNAFMRYNALFLDVQNFKYRYMEGRDTDIKKNTQPNDADYRKVAVPRSQLVYGWRDWYCVINNTNNRNKIMSDIRKGNLREVQPTLSGGTQSVMGGTVKEAGSDSLKGKNIVKEYVPGKLSKGGGSDGGKGQRN
jgi:hypothetical protein